MCDAGSAIYDVGCAMWLYGWPVEPLGLLGFTMFLGFFGLETKALNEPNKHNKLNEPTTRPLIPGHRSLPKACFFRAPC